MMTDPSPPSFGSAEYWESEYETNLKSEELYDWLEDWEDVGWLMCSLLAHDHSKKILHLGNGNSAVPEELHKLGYTKQIATDISQCCTKHMQERLADTSIQFLQVDACDLQPKEVFADASFDLVIDKSTLDALECNDDNHAVLKLLLLKETHRVLKPGGTFLSISMHGPKIMDVFLRLRCFGWRIKCVPLLSDLGHTPQQSSDIDAAEDTTTVMNRLKQRYEKLCAAPAGGGRRNYHYCYICTEKRDSAMEEHWNQIFETVSEAPDDDPPRMLREDGDEMVAHGETQPAKSVVDDRKFKYVLIPMDATLPLKEYVAEAAVYGDTLVQLLKIDFAGGVLTNVDDLRKQFGSTVDEKMGALQAAADTGGVELLPLVRTSKTTLPVPNLQTSLYYDEMGALKGKPPNTRAVALAKQCGLDLEHPLPGDVFVGRVCCDPGPVSMSIELHELHSSSPWIQQAPAENAAWKGALSNFNDITRCKKVGEKTTEEEESESNQRGWSWTQSEEEVEVTVSLPEGTAKGDINVVIRRSSLHIVLKTSAAPSVLDLKLYKHVSAEDSTWTMGANTKGSYVQVSLCKEQEETWPTIVADRNSQC